MIKLMPVVLGLLLAACERGPEGTSSGDCSDHKDNDNNGFVDCEDSGCNLDDYCLELAARAKATAEAARTAANAVRETKTAPGNPDYFEIEGLWVQRGHNGADADFAHANRYCEKLILAGKDDWRLPTTEEATAAVATGKMASESLVMWTSDKKSNTRGTIVGISTGAVNELGLYFKGQCRARCVRDAN